MAAKELQPPRGIITSSSSAFKCQSALHNGILPEEQADYSANGLQAVTTDANVVLGGRGTAEQICNNVLEKEAKLKTAYTLKLLDSYRAQFQDSGGKQSVS